MNLNINIQYSILIIIALVLAIVGVTTYMIFRNKKRTENNSQLNTCLKKPIDLGKDSEGNKLSIQMESFLMESFVDNTDLVEIKDSTVLARIDNLIPGLAQSGVATANALDASGEIVYRAIIPAGTKLTNSKTMEGAVRGFYQGADGIQGHANLVAVNKKASAVANSTVAAMNVASMIVGQYYMTQINEELGEISDGIEKISSFQDDEYKSHVFALVTQIKKIASFQVEIIENDELRMSEIAHLNELEDECIKLLGQANLAIAGFAKHNNLDYTNYEKRLNSAQNWYVYQQNLLEMLYKIADLKYTLYLGNVSRNQCEALLPQYTKQVSDAQELLAEWHEKTVKRLGIDIDKNKRKRSGFDGAIHWIPGLFDKKNNYKSISKRTADLIGVQMVGHERAYDIEQKELYSEDVQLIAKDGKLYYCPTKSEVKA